MSEARQIPTARKSVEDPPTLAVVDYDPAWPRRFAEIQGMIQRTIPGTYYAVEHVGGTSVPGMAGKPIIDIDIVMREGRFGRIKSGLESLGYDYEGDLGRPGRYYFELRDPRLRNTLAQHHLNVCEPDAEFLANQRDFRDFLLRHPEWVARLSAHKKELFSKHRPDYYAYQQAKAPMVQEILALARKELENP
jgi:GrpB-like predicted nucleotidyltransferase (UPF0157 family)